MAAFQDSTDLRAVIQTMSELHPALNTERIARAVEVAIVAYGDHAHWSGDTVLQHVSGVLGTLLPFEPDEDAIIACILHHILLAEDWNLVQLEEEFGAKVRSLVSGVHLLSHVTMRGRRSSIEDLRIMLLTVSDDVRTVLISLCDHAYLLSRIDKLPTEDRRQLCIDVLGLFAPVAARLGIYSVKHDLESKAFPVMYPLDAETIHEQIAKVHAQHGEFIQKSADLLEAYLRKNGIRSAIISRQKQPYSLFSKMRQKSITHISDVYDLYALRVMVGSVEDCYQVLGLLHRIARPVAHRFKDYISFPKPNGYQSLHTTLMHVPGAPEDVMVEVQVRTKDMHREAEFGIAAHWSYKTYGSTTLALEHAQLHQMLASQEILEDETTTQLVDHIFVLTPKGDVVELPEGASPLDFAFRVHTDLGLCFRGARVNGSMVPLEYELENGDVIEILKHTSPRPSPQWVQHLKMASARSKLKHYLYEQDRPKLIVNGRQMVNQMLKKYKLSVLDQDLSLLKEVDGVHLSMQQREDILMKIGQGSEKPSSLLDRVEALHRFRTQDASPKSRSAKSTPRRKRVVQLDGGVPMPTRLAKCCKPSKGKTSSIVGVISRSGEVVIHKKKCGMLRNANPARQIKASWNT